MNIRRATKDDSHAIADLHARNLAAEEGQGKARLALLALYYEELCSSEDSFCFVHMSETESIDGFVCMLSSPQRVIWQCFRNQTKRLLFGLALFLAKPPYHPFQLTGKLWELIKLMWGQGRLGGETGLQVPNLLRPIIVDESIRGSSVAKELLNSAESELVRRGVTGYRLIVDEDNARAITFYKKQKLLLALRQGTDLIMVKALKPGIAGRIDFGIGDRGTGDPFFTKPCPLCEMDGYSPALFSTRYFISNDEQIILPWIRCHGCGTYFSAEFPGRDYFLKHLENVDYGRAEKSDAIGRQKQKLHVSILDEIARWNPSGTSVLDYGCSFGVFLEMAEERGLTGYGIDANPMAIDVLTGRGVKVTLGDDISAARAFGISFSAIVINDVLCYIEDPSRTLKISYELLEPGGVLVIRASNKASWLSAGLRFIGPKEIVINGSCLDHFHVADVTAYQNALRKAGFHVANPGVGAKSSDNRDLSIPSRWAYALAHLLSLISFGRIILSPGILLTAVKEAEPKVQTLR